MNPSANFYRKDVAQSKPLVEFEHCLIECLGELEYQHKLFNECIEETVNDCIKAETKESFFNFYHVYQREKQYFGQLYSVGSPVGEYFSTLRDRLLKREGEQIDKSQSRTFPVIVSTTHSRMLSVMICNQIDKMWNSASYDKTGKVNSLWDHWMNSRSGIEQYCG